jgi:hypothetical protein
VELDANDHLALLDFREGIVNRADLPWNTSSNKCEDYAGVLCDQNGKVTFL